MTVFFLLWKVVYITHVLTHKSTESIPCILLAPVNLCNANRNQYVTLYPQKLNVEYVHDILVDKSVLLSSRIKYDLEQFVLYDRSSYVMDSKYHSFFAKEERIRKVCKHYDIDYDKLID